MYKMVGFSRIARLRADCIFLTFKKHCRYDNIYLLLHSNELFKKNLENSLVNFENIANFWEKICFSSKINENQ